MWDIDEEKMKKFDELQQKALDTERTALAARKEFFNFVEELQGSTFKDALSFKMCQIDRIFLPKYKAFAGFVEHKRKNFCNHWWNTRTKSNNFGKFCDAVRNRDILLVKILPDDPFPEHKQELKL